MSGVLHVCRLDCSAQAVCIMQATALLKLWYVSISACACTPDYNLYNV